MRLWKTGASISPSHVSLYLSPRRCISSSRLICDLWQIDRLWSIHRQPGKITETINTGQDQGQRSHMAHRPVLAYRTFPLSPLFSVPNPAALHFY